MDNIVTEVKHVIGVFDGTSTAGDIGLKKLLGPYSPVEHLKQVKVGLSYSSRPGQIPKARASLHLTRLTGPIVRVVLVNPLGIQN